MFKICFLLTGVAFSFLTPQLLLGIDGVIAQAQSPFTYAYNTEILHGAEQSFALSADIENFAKHHNRHLAMSPFFDRIFLDNPQKVRALHVQPKQAQGEIGHIFEVQTDDNVTIQGTWFNRSSDTLLVVGKGFRSFRERYSSFLHLFPEYDVVLFDFRGIGYSPIELTNPSTWYWSVGKFLSSIDAHVTTYGDKEDKDVYAVVNGLKNHKKYRRIFGAGACFGGGIFLKTQVLHPGFFDKIIIDSCWESLDQILDVFHQNPGLMINSQHGEWIKIWPFDTPWMKNFILLTLFKLSGCQFPKVSITEYASQVSNVPILFLYGKQDLMISKSSFEKLWTSLNVSEKTAVVTTAPHTSNHIEHKEMYKMLGELFFELPYDAFVACTTNIQNIYNYYCNCCKNLQ